MKLKKVNLKKMNGFTLIELLIVIGIIAVLAAFTFVALNPLARFQDSRNARRWSDVNSILAAVKLDQVDHGGNYISDIASLTEGEYYQIGAGESNIVCNNPEVLLQPNCVNFENIVSRGYLPSVPFDPNADNASAIQSHYFIMRDARGVVTVGACDEEQGSNSSIPEISVSR